MVQQRSRFTIFIASVLVSAGSLGAFAVLPAFAQASTSVSINSLSPSATIAAGTTVSFTVGASGFSNPSFSVSDSFPNSSVNSSSINSSGTFSWTPTSNDAGTHTLTLNVSDSQGNIGSANESLNVTTGPTIQIQSVSPGFSVVAGTPLTFTVGASGFINPIYTISDSFGNSSVSNSDFSASGNTAGFTWTPNNNDIGSHSLVISVGDSYGHLSNVTEQVTVTNPQVTVELVSPGTNVYVGQSLIFDIIPSGFSYPSFSFRDSFINSTLSNSDVTLTTNSNGTQYGAVTWVPTIGDVGTHTILINAADNNSHYASDTISIAVNNDGTAFVPPAQPLVSTPVSSTVPTTPVTTPAQTNSAAVLVFTSSLSLGSQNSQVTQLQTLLKSEGFLSASTALTGYFGAATQQAVDDFQTAHNLSVVGIVGPQTRAILNQLIAASESSTPVAASSVPASSASAASPSSVAYTFNVTLAEGSSGATVTALQNRLTKEGIYSGPVTGYFGAATEAAVEKYQSKHGLSPVGIVGPQTRAYLNEGI